MTKILVIDDEKIIRESLATLLKLDGYHVFIAEDGSKGLETFGKEKPEIVLVDIRMPGIDGIDVLKNIRESSKKTEVIMITGHGGVDTAIEALKKGAFGYIQKPVEYDELEMEVKKAIEKQSMQKKLDEYVYYLEKAVEENTRELRLRKKAEEALQANINQGREYQTKLIKIKFPKIYNIRFYSNYIPYDIVGGDIYNLVMQNNKIIFYLSDLAGHGVPSAILSAYIKAHIDGWIIRDRIMSPKSLIFLLKDALKDQEIFKENMLTLFIGVIDIEKLSLTYISAGHFLPFVFTRNKMDKMEFLNLKDTFMPITNIVESTDYEEKTTVLKNDTKIFMYSDGLIEWVNEHNQFIGVKGLKDFIKKNGLSNESIENFVSKGIKYHQKDDVSYILIEINDNYEKIYFYDLKNYDKIINDFKIELENRYSKRDTNIRAIQCFCEIVMNAIEHGNKNSKKKKLLIKVKFNKNLIFFSIKDEGKGFNWASIDFLDPRGCSKIRGRGLFLVKYFSNKLEFNEKGNEINVELSMT